MLIWCEKKILLTGWKNRQQNRVDFFFWVKYWHMLGRGGGGIDGGPWGERRNKKGQGKASAVLALLLYSNPGD